jgi:hypothetical protein
LVIYDPDSGLKVGTLEDIITIVKETFQTEFGNDIDLNEGSVFFYFN